MYWQGIKRPFGFALLVCVTVLTQCRNHEVKTERTTAVTKESYDTGEEVTVKHATHFTVKYFTNYKVVTTNGILSHYKGDENQPQEDVMVLIPRGTEVPQLPQELSGAAIIPIPPGRVALNIENIECFLRELDLEQAIVAVGGLTSYNDNIRSKAKRGAIGQIGFSWHQPPNIEVLLERKAELVFMNLTNLDFRSGLDKCRQMGIPTAPVFSWAEEDYLARAEWIKFYAVFFNKEAEANRIFETIEHNCDSLKQLALKVANKPTAIWGFYQGGDTWAIHRHSIETQLMRDAGLNNVFEEPSLQFRNWGEPMSTEELLKNGKSADHWIIGDIYSSALPPERIMNSFNAWRTNQLYHTFKRSKPAENANDWLATGTVHPDWILADLIMLTQPTLVGNREPYFMDVFKKNTSFPIMRDGN